MVCFTGAESVGVAVGAAGCDSFRALAHLAFCACAIFRRDAADMIRVGWFVFAAATEPFNDSITEIAWSNFSACNCTSRRSARSCCSAFVRFPIVPPQFEQRFIVEGYACY